jgi:F-type H+-transporting ATPase subunit b
MGGPRLRALLAGLLLVVGVFVAGGVGAAHAQETNNPASENTDPGGSTESTKEPSKEAEECIEILEDGGEPDDCQEAPSPILPPTNELIWGGISFFVLLGLLAKFAYPGIKKGMADRTERIRTDLEGAEAAKADAQRVLDEYRAQLADAKTEAGRIIEEARQQADALKRDQAQRLQTELATMRERASADVEAAKTQAIADLRSEVAQLAIGAAEVVVQHNLDPATQTQLVEQYIQSVAGQSTSN